MVGIIATTLIIITMMSDYTVCRVRNVWIEKEEDGAGKGVDEEGGLDIQVKVRRVKLRALSRKINKEEEEQEEEKKN